MTRARHTRLFAKMSKPLRPSDEEYNQLNDTEDSNAVDHDVLVVTSHRCSTIMYAAHTTESLSLSSNDNNNSFIALHDNTAG